MTSTVFLVRLCQTYAEIDNAQLILTFGFRRKCVRGNGVGQAQAVKGAVVSEISPEGLRGSTIPSFGADFDGEVLLFYKHEGIVQRRRFRLTDAVEGPRAGAVTIYPEGYWPFSELLQFVPWKLAYLHPSVVCIDLMVFCLMVMGRSRFIQGHVDDVQKLGACIVLISALRQPHLRGRPRA